MATDTGVWKRGIIPKGSPLYDEHGRIMGYTSADANFVSTEVEADPVLLPANSSVFPNLARRDPVDSAEVGAVTRVAAAELEAAGIAVLLGPTPVPGEVPSRAMGALGSWLFRRAWCYWVANGQGLPVEAAEALHATHGKEVRVMGHCGAPSPLDYLRGQPCPCYHVDTPDGLKALAAALRAVGTEETVRIAELVEKEDDQ